MMAFWVTMSAVGQASDTRIVALDAPEYTTRVEATEALMVDVAVDVPQLTAWYRDATSEEVRQRLLAVIRQRVLTRLREERFANAGRASLGVVHRVEPSLRLGLEREGVQDGTAHIVARVIRTLPGFPAEGLLRPDDWVVAVDGRTLNNLEGRSSFEALLHEYAGGDRVTLRVDRDGDMIDLPVTLVGSNALAAMYDPETLSLRPEFEDAWRPAGIE